MQGQGEGGSGPSAKIWGGVPHPVARADRQGERYGNATESVVRKMAAGRKCRQHNKSLRNYIW